MVLCYIVIPNVFWDFSFVMMSGETGFASDLRQLAASCIRDDPTTYNEAFLGMSNGDYCKWLSGKDKWGGKTLFKNSLIDFMFNEIR